MAVSCVSPQARQRNAQINQALNRRAVDAVMRGQFVLEANRLMFSRGNMANVIGNTNFITMQNGRVIIQTSLNRGRWPGPNNLGGVTYNARPSSIRIKTDRRGDLHLSMHAQGAMFSGRIEMTVFAGSNIATARVIPTFRGKRVVFHGVVVPAETSHIVRGRAL